MNIILLGPPGAGKGTQASLLCEKFSIGHISTGEMLRQATHSNTEIGLQVKQIIDAGRLVQDDIMINLVVEEISRPLYKKGFLLDGFPRNIVQAKHLHEAGIKVTLIIYLDLADQIIVERLAGRRYHPASGRVYHVKYHPPQHTDIDDLTGEPLIIRKDDHEDVIRHRLSVYHQNTKPLIDWYQSLQPEEFINIDASHKQADIFKQINEIVVAKHLANR